MANKLVFNPMTGGFDVIDDDVQNAASAPTTGSSGTIYFDEGNPTDAYYFVGANRYKLTGVLDNPILTDKLLLETGDYLLLETGDKLLFE